MESLPSVATTDPEGGPGPALEAPSFHGPSARPVCCDGREPVCATGSLAPTGRVSSSTPAAPGGGWEARPGMDRCGQSPVTLQPETGNENANLTPFAVPEGPVHPIPPPLLPR